LLARTEKDRIESLDLMVRDAARCAAPHHEV
jgi:hypothetical protein